jgi:membrane fusion protein (multidrug efflux system)
MKFPRRGRQLAVVLAAISALSACSEQQPSAAGPAAAPPPPEVAVVRVQPKPVAVTEVLPGRLEASQVADVRARASGIVLERTFREGSQVKAGQILFRIDPAPLQAALNSAKAALAKAQANLTQARVTAERYAPLVETRAVSQQEYDNAVAARAQAEADVAAAEAAIETARLNLDYATVEAPISGRIGRAQVTVGALVGQGEPTRLATIQKVDPIYANLTQSSAEVLRLRRAFASGELESAGDGQAKVTLIMEDGIEYPHPGRLLFTDMTVDQATGAVILRAEFPNPDGFLLPGMYVRARLQQAVNENAITVPQQAVVRSAQGASVMVVGEDGKVAARPVEVGRTYQNTWIINSGLQAGERVIVEGLQKARPGAPVKPVPWQESAKTTTAGQAQN